MSNESDRDVEGDRALRALFAHAQPRPQPPVEAADEVRRAVLAEWEAVAGRRVFRRRAGFASAAAILLAAVIYVGGGRDPTDTVPLVASVERLQGDAATGTASRLVIGSGLVAGTEIVTGDGQLALRLATGGSLRVAPRSRVVLASDAAELVVGMIYFDSEQRRDDAQFVVLTELGRIRDVGTQFLVRLNESERQLDIGVRDGRVTLLRNGASDSVEAGERIAATADASAVRRESMTTFGGEWEWAERLAPPFDIDGRTVGDFVEWFAAQTGRTVVFSDAGAERLAQATVLNGSIDLEPLQKLAAVDALTDLDFALEGGRVVIRAP